MGASAMFAGVDLSCMTADQKNYLTMHSCFKFLIDRDDEARRTWKERTFLLRADDGALGWILDLEDPEDPDLSWTTSAIAGRHGARWLYNDDAEWVGNLLLRAPVLKFIGLHAGLFDAQPMAHLLRDGSNISRLLAAALQARTLEKAGAK